MRVRGAWCRWMVSFGLGAIGMAGCVLALVSVRPVTDPKTGGCTIAGRPSFHVKVLGPPGCAGVFAGSFWAVSMLCLFDYCGVCIRSQRALEECEIAGDSEPLFCFSSATF